MILATQKAQIRPVHPFPARMAPSIVWDALPKTGPSLRILDPMSGSGTTLVSARARGHHAIGYDTDPLAILIARVWCADTEPDEVKHRANHVLVRAKRLQGRLLSKESYPKGTDNDTRQFIDFWFDQRNRQELNALATCISRVRSQPVRTILWCAFSRMIITKTGGASLAMDISHSRPHKVYKIALVRPFDIFIKAVAIVVKNGPFLGHACDAPAADIHFGDARMLPIESASVDMIITSPPYLNAIDYLRGHKLSLVWMGHTISEIRSLRSGNIGTEVSKESGISGAMQKAMISMGHLELLENRYLGMVRRYVWDMSKVMGECARVLKSNGRAVFVVGNSAIRGVYIKNSEAIVRLAVSSGLSLTSQSTRPIEGNRRYLPPPESNQAGGKMQSRMREETILEFQLF
ncbi:MAG: hypothetical protein IIA59_09050 [Candidatus Marinimicrobia bacterium]|nr:hypothetical protein [Candidatus Neomarinimicrobiota bacterium]